MEEAALARQVAYTLITKLAAFSFGRENRPFELPIFLIKCAVYNRQMGWNLFHATHDEQPKPHQRFATRPSLISWINPGPENIKPE